MGRVIGRGRLARANCLGVGVRTLAQVLCSMWVIIAKDSKPAGKLSCARRFLDAPKTVFKILAKRTISVNAHAHKHAYVPCYNKNQYFVIRIRNIP